MIRPRYSQADRLARPSQAFIDQVARAVLRMQREVYPPGTDPRGKGRQYGRGPVLPVFKAVVASGISASSGNNYGSGAVELYASANPDDEFGTADPDVSSIPCNNWYQNSGTVPVGAHCMVFPSDGGLWLLTWDC